MKNEVGYLLRASLKTIFQLKYLDNLMYYGTVYYM